ncbi:hypothetical protein QJQ45_010938 [Haematococcus lacustris]|nr:hypothetical protein QJQ45_010938 [Haematococcus lacustris]
MPLTLALQAQQLLGLLANLFPCRAGGSHQQERVAPYHKSVLAWLTSAAGMSAGQFHVGTQQGHRLLASSCLQQAVQCVADGQADSPLACTRQGAGLGCSLRHAVAHACLSGEGQQTVPALSQSDMQHQVTVDGSASARDVYSPAGETTPPSTRLLDLPPALLDDIACRVMQLGTRSLLPLTCRAFSQAHLLHVPALRIQLSRQCCDQLLTPQVPLVLNCLHIGVEDISNPDVAAALHNMAYACKVPVKIKKLRLAMLTTEEQRSGVITPAFLQQQRVDLAKLVNLLQPLKCCGMVVVCDLHKVTAADILALAPLCRDCTWFDLSSGSLTASLEFWRQLLHLMPVVQKVTFFGSKDFVSEAMHQSLQLMAEQPWARWLDIAICPSLFDTLEVPACWQDDSWSKRCIFEVKIE